MKKLLLTALLLALLPGMLGGCAGTAEEEEARVSVVASTYPVYLFASAVADGVEGVKVERLDTGSQSCLHDYTLSVDDMKKLEGADVIALNGVGLEDFMADALSSSSARVVDCSAGAALLESLNHDHQEGDEADHDHGHYDPHIWMDPANAAVMVGNIEEGLAQADPDHAQDYAENRTEVTALLESWDSNLHDLFRSAQEDGVEIAGLVTFHDGFQYFAAAYGLPLLSAIEEEAGSEASAKEVQEITALVKEKGIPVIFTEVNGSDATAQAIRRETGCAVAELTMLMDGPDSALDHYLEGLTQNVKAILNGFAGEEVVE